MTVNGQPFLQTHFINWIFCVLWILGSQNSKFRMNFPPFFCWCHSSLSEEHKIPKSIMWYVQRVQNHPGWSIRPPRLCSPNAQSPRSSYSLFKNRRKTTVRNILHSNWELRIWMMWMSWRRFSIPNTCKATESILLSHCSSPESPWASVVMQGSLLLDPSFPSPRAPPSSFLFWCVEWVPLK